jgi:hypothetical protein
VCVHFFGGSHLAIPIRRGNIDEFVRLAAKTFNTDERAAEIATADMLVRQFEGGQPYLDDLLDSVPGARDLVFAGLLLYQTQPKRPVGFKPPVAPELLSLFLAYWRAHSTRPLPES